MNCPDRTRVKICGVTTESDVRAAANAGADAIGIVFAAGSLRRVSPTVAALLLRAAPAFVTPIGVFRSPLGWDDPAIDAWLAVGGSWCQVHGDVQAGPPRVRPDARYIRGEHFSAAAARTWDQQDGIDALLLDGSSGGAGESFDHHELAALMPELTRPVILAGGLDPDNVGRAVRTVRPWAVDVSTGVENSAGRKDHGAMRAFCAAVRAAG